jgi:hypothetical protein
LSAVTLTSSPIWHTIPIISLGIKNRLLFVVDTNYIFCEVRTELL